MGQNPSGLDVQDFRTIEPVRAQRIIDAINASLRGHGEASIGVNVNVPADGAFHTALTIPITTKHDASRVQINGSFNINSVNPGIYFCRILVDGVPGAPAPTQNLTTPAAEDVQPITSYVDIATAGAHTIDIQFQVADQDVPAAATVWAGGCAVAREVSP